MIPNFKAPFSAFTANDNNPASFVIGHHYEAVSGAIDRLVDMYNDDIDIGDRQIFNSVLKHYGLLDDGFCSEEAYIIEEVKRRINC